jgi:hypothetical protein
MKSKSSILNSVLLLSLMAGRCPLLLGQETNTAPPAGTAVSTVAGPKIQFATPVYDFGKATVGEPVKYEYVFTNTGDALLIVSNVQPGCGCTTAGNWTREVAPQQTGTIPVQFNNTAYQGPVTKSIKVTSNDKSNPTVDLQLKVTVWRPIQVSPQNAIFNLPPDLMSNSTTVLNIHNNSDEPLTLSDPELNVHTFTAEIKTIQPGKDFELAVSTVAPLESGNVQGQITIRTSSKQMPALAILALARIQPAVTVTPSLIILPAGSPDNFLTSMVSIQNNSSVPLVLSEPSVNYETADGNDKVQVEIKEIVPGRQFSVTLNFPKGFEPAPAANLELSIHSSNPQLKIIKVPIKQTAPPVPTLPPPAQLSAAPAGK